MPNTSATGGALAPVASPKADQALDAVFQVLVSQLTGLSGDLVRPRYQSEAANMPGFSQTWVSVGVYDFNPDTYGSVDHKAGSSDLTQHESISVLVSFYGPAAMSKAYLLIGGLQISQNRESLISEGIAYQSCNRPVRAPQMLKNRWVDRFDITLNFRRQNVMNYPILDIAEVDGNLTANSLSRTLKIP